MKRVVYMVATPSGPAPVSGYIVPGCRNLLGIHHKGIASWTVTHLPSGHRVVGELSTRGEALVWAREAYEAAASRGVAWETRLPERLGQVLGRALRSAGLLAEGKPIVNHVPPPRSLNP